ncbi:glycerol-3-phosphate responsive antiterminator [Edaphobacter flagellatus]|uniref:glycerol-3-phosphate responsive antiterminator n=1 Tax=Edaphobacter flagellatus TaxID=1933044 RepID=UPI0021B1AF0C|nr:glycerol-3-phosphate responsive antiterminator [Edaphobacter flagellatus]
MLEKKTNKPVRDKALWDEALKESPVIAAVRSEETLESALASPVRLVYLLFGNPMNLERMIAAARSRKKLLLVNADLLQGFSRDAYAVEYLAHCDASGIISTHHGTLQAARTHGLITVLRTFMIDSAAVEGAKRFLAHFQPDAVELLPAIAAPVVLDSIREAHPTLKVIAGGLISDLKQVESLVQAGVDAVSLSRPGLWVV